MKPDDLRNWGHEESHAGRSLRASTLYVLADIVGATALLLNGLGITRRGDERRQRVADKLRNLEEL